jgi:hypothetical protein
MAKCRRKSHSAPVVFCYKQNPEPSLPRFCVSVGKRMVPGFPVIPRFTGDNQSNTGRNDLIVFSRNSQSLSQGRLGFGGRGGARRSDRRGERGKVLRRVWLRLRATQRRLKGRCRRVRQGRNLKRNWEGWTSLMRRPPPGGGRS